MNPQSVEDLQNELFEIVKLGTHRIKTAAGQKGRDFLNTKLKVVGEANLLYSQKPLHKGKIHELIKNHPEDFYPFLDLNSEQDNKIFSTLNLHNAKTLAFQEIKKSNISHYIYNAIKSIVENPELLEKHTANTGFQKIHEIYIAPKNGAGIPSHISKQISAYYLNDFFNKYPCIELEKYIKDFCIKNISAFKDITAAKGFQQIFGEEIIIYNFNNFNHDDKTPLELFKHQNKLLGLQLIGDDIQEIEQPVQIDDTFSFISNETFSKKFPNSSVLTNINSSGFLVTNGHNVFIIPDNVIRLTNSIVHPIDTNTIKIDEHFITEFSKDLENQSFMQKGFFFKYKTTQNGLDYNTIYYIQKLEQYSSDTPVFAKLIYLESQTINGESKTIVKSKRVPLKEINQAHIEPVSTFNLSIFMNNIFRKEGQIIEHNIEPENQVLEKYSLEQSFNIKSCFSKPQF